MNLVTELPDRPLDIIGDIHGEIDALELLLERLGYSPGGHHPQNRIPVFVGDLVDRGPDSHGVVRRVQELVENHQARAILGNHELNLLTDDIKDGSGWFFDERYQQDLKNYAPFTRTPASERHEIRTFLNSLPVVLLGRNLRIVHAAWSQTAVQAIQDIPLGNVTEAFKRWDEEAQKAAEHSGLYDQYLEEKQRWAKALEDDTTAPPVLEHIAQYEAMQQMVNPFKVLTSGVEQKAVKPFFAGGRWRFSDRVNWWDDYRGTENVVIGHYWRLYRQKVTQASPRYTQLFSNIHSVAWYGYRQKVFCIDYSVGARWRDRKANRPVSQSRFKLGALRWPENQLVFDDGTMVDTIR
ncbi:metallophosphoesterase [Pusillimonas minor]|uniref:Metallophosphoesterase n=1 Tax=Pusillimonas minor TaxID=2697024 RepID=A0A842HMI3_9BURK|nr:metallophosphoesterase [Pusillimonas minor]MBC2769114.1 metallophosphoesterase [Pusillimonas minor]